MYLTLASMFFPHFLNGDRLGKYAISTLWKIMKLHLKLGFTSVTFGKLTSPCLSYVIH